jgi:hypothetical protein
MFRALVFREWAKLPQLKEKKIFQDGIFLS